jgi:hypothetical protein
MKHLFFTLILFFPIISAAQFDLSVGIAYDWDDLDKKDKERIKQSSDNYIRKLVQNDVEGFYELCHPKFKEQTPFIAFKEIGGIIANMISSNENVEFIDAKKVVYTEPPQISKFSTGGSIDKNDPSYLQFYTLAGIENQSISLFKVNRKPISKMITMKFGFEEDEYKLTSFDINSCSVNGKDAQYYINIANKWENEESGFPKFMALNMAYRLSYLGQGTSTTTMIELTEKLQTLQKNTDLVNEVKKWDINDSIYDVFNVDFIETQSDITPNVIYLSKVELGENSTEDEVKHLFKYFTDKYPELAKRI